jgi:hydrogenase maturation protease
MLIAGIGNIFLGDDAFGVEVIQRLLRRPVPDRVRVLDIGIRGLDLAYALLDNYDVAILVDATPRGGAPGTLYMLEPDLSALDQLTAPETALETHSMHPMRVLAWVKAMGGTLPRVLFVGCEPTALDTEEGQMGLSVPVQAAVAEAVVVLESLIEAFLAQEAANHA